MGKSTGCDECRFRMSENGGTINLLIGQLPSKLDSVSSPLHCLQPLPVAREADASMDRRRQQRLALAVGATAAAAGAAYLVYKLLASETQERGDSGEAEERREPEPQQHPHAEPAAEAAEAVPAVVGKRGRRWWYEGSKGLDKKAGVAAQQRAEAAAKKVNEQAMAAAQEGDVATLERLLDQGWAVDSRDKYGGTALHWAAGKGRVQSVELLLQRNADAHARLYKGGGRGRCVLRAHCMCQGRRRPTPVDAPSACMACS